MDTASDLKALLEHGEQAFTQGDLEGARHAFEQALKQDDAPARQRASALDGLGAVCASSGDLERAMQYCHQAMELLEEHEIEDVSTPYSNMASVMVMAGQEVSAALELWERALAIERARTSPDQEALSSLLMDMAIAAGFVPDWPRALELIEEALTLSEALLGPHSYQALSQRVYMLECFDHLADAKRALAASEAFIELLPKLRVSQDRELIEQGLPMLATALSQQGRCEEADAIFTHVLNELDTLDDVDPELLDAITENRDANDVFRHQILMTAAQWETEEELSVMAYQGADDDDDDQAPN